ncbi:hypothetical protein ZIOFF_007591 [Zingiber officinale]|uniref:Uncharacterized protein n=1 Tax=Zingiber officinale TaxID=94328 RepID=A0A8J5IEX6_ZINOF|nr:hypothetical protein ZIOFF_007591 [Zingiber officinale]
MKLSRIHPLMPQHWQVTWNDVGQNPFASLLGNQGGVQSRDQTPGQPGTGSNLTSELVSPNSNPVPNPWSRTEVHRLPTPHQLLEVMEDLQASLG